MVKAIDYLKYLIVFCLLTSNTYATCNFKKVRSGLGSIDVVYTWVDGEDPLWQHNLSQTVESCSHSCVVDALSKSRFRSRDELKYSLRSIAKYAPFVNHIYIVTCSQIPRWLKPHSKITVVDHKTIFFNKSDLPTFNSLAIEANLHHIPDLSECYIYFNDDVFLGAPTKKSDFFAKHGKPKIFLDSWMAPEGKVRQDDSTFDAAWKNSNDLLNRLFGKRSRYALQHAPFVFRRSYQKTMEKCLTAVFKNVSGHKFRSPDDLLLTAGFSQYFQHAHDIVKMSKIESIVVGMKDDLYENARQLAEIALIKPQTFCIEDAMLEDSLLQDELLHSFLENYFPEPAPWE